MISAALCLALFVVIVSAGESFGGTTSFLIEAVRTPGITPQKVKALIDAGADVIAVLISAGSDVHAKDISGCTALHNAGHEAKEIIINAVR